METTETKSIVVLDTLKALDFKLDESEATEIKEAFMPTVREVAELDKEYFEITEASLEATTPERAEKARKLRLKLVEKRGTKGIKGIHEKRKAYYLNGGRFVDGIKNTITASLESAEEKLDAIENYEENKKKKAIQDKHDERIKSLEPFEYKDIGTNFWDMPETDWDHHYNFIKSTYETKIANDKAEADRVANLKTENEWLKTETETLKVETQELKQVVEEAKTENTELKATLEQKKELEKTQQEIIADLQHFKDSSIGLWCTDKPEIIPENVKHLFFQLK